MSEISERFALLQGASVSLPGTRARNFTAGYVIRISPSIIQLLEQPDLSAVKLSIVSDPENPLLPKVLYFTPIILPSFSF